MNVPALRESLFREIDSSEKLDLSFSFASYFEIPALLLSAEGELIKYTPAVMEIFEACNPSLIIGDSDPNGFLEHIRREPDLQNFIFNGVPEKGAAFPAFEYTFENKAVSIDARISRFAFDDEILLTFTTQNINPLQEIVRDDTLILGDLKRQYTHTRSEIVTSSSHRNRNLDYQLSKAKKHLDNAQELTGIGNFYYDLHNDEVWWSDQLYTILGRDLDEGPEYSLFALLKRVVGGDFQELKHLLRRLKEGNELTKDFKFRRYADDKVISLRVMFSPVAVNGRISQMNAIIMDISLSDQFEQVEMMYSLLMNNASDAIIIAGLDYKIQSWNAAAENLLGWNASEAEGKTIVELCSPEYPDEDGTERKKSLAAAKNWKGTIKLKHKNGSEKIVDATANPLIDSNAHQIGYMAIYRDITDIYHLRNQLDWRKKLFDGFMARLPLMTFIKRGDDYVYANPELIRLFKEIEPDYSIQGATEIASEFEAPNQLAEKLASGDDLLLQQENEFLEWNFDLDLNERRCFLKMIKFRLGNMNNAVYTGGLLIDLTSEMKYQQQLKNEKERAESADKLKLTLLQNLSHEFRTPLTGIIGYAGVLQNADSAKYSKWGDRIFRSADRLKNTLNNLLDYAALISSSYRPQITSFPVSDLLSCVEKNFRKEAEKKGLSFLIEDCCSNCSIESDFSLLSSAFLLLADNAVKFTQQGAVVCKSALDYEEGKEHLKIVIQDTGIGIPDEQLAVIFNEFEQVSQGISRNYEGLGLGLTIAQKKIHLLQGRIDITSQPGKGAFVEILVPASIKTEEASPKSERIVEEDVRKERSEKPKVLLVDDNEIIYDVFSVMLEEKIELDYASDGAQALNTIETRQYDIVLMDINLKSDMDGVEVLKKIREGKYAKLPVVAVTGYAMPGDEQRFLDEGFDAYLSKPLTAEAMLSVVYSIVDVRE